MVPAEIGDGASLERSMVKPSAAESKRPYGFAVGGVGGLSVFSRKKN